MYIRGKNEYQGGNTDYTNQAKQLSVNKIKGAVFMKLTVPSHKIMIRGARNNATKPTKKKNDCQKSALRLLTEKMSKSTSRLGLFCRFKTDFL